MAVPKLSPVGMYGGVKDVWEQLLKEGFTEVAHGGSGKEVDGVRLVGLFAFFHPKGRVATIETFKDYTGPASVRGAPTRHDYRKAKVFEAHLEKFKASLGPRFPLQQALADWPE